MKRFHAFILLLSLAVPAGAQTHTMDHATHDTEHRDTGAHADEQRRSADYSDGVAAGHMPGMEMPGDKPLGLLAIDRLEDFSGGRGHGQRWELAGWYGGDIDRFALRSTGERIGHGIEGGNVEALWSHAVAAFWNTELGLRHDIGDGPARDWLAFGVAGLAPYYFDLRATLYLGAGGRSALGLRAGHDMRFTQRLILEPEVEAMIHNGGDAARDADTLEAGLRLRYEIRRESGPYAGLVWTHRHGRGSRTTHDRQWVAGLRFRF